MIMYHLVVWSLVALMAGSWHRHSPGGMRHVDADVHSHQLLVCSFSTVGVCQVIGFICSFGQGVPTRSYVQYMIRIPDT
jgi:hypothetical protein